MGVKSEELFQFLFLSGNGLERVFMVLGTVPVALVIAVTEFASGYVFQLKVLLLHQVYSL